MAKLTGTQFAEKWGGRLKSATDSITLGVQNVTVSPTASAANKKDKFRANLLKSIDDGRWEKGLRKVTLEAWREAMLNRGVPRIAAGVDGAMTDMAAFGEELLAYEAQAQAKIAKMPDVSLEDNLARMTTFVREMANFRRKS